MAQEETVMEEKKVMEIPPYANIKVYWDDRPENYSRINRNKIRNDVARKYGVDKTNINVVFRPIKINEKGETIEVDGAGIENIMDSGYQRQLFKEWLEREGKKVDLERLYKLDDKVNGSLEIDLDQQTHRKWELKWLTLNNFLCFGEDNYVPFSKCHGLTVVNSLPLNQGGKTTFSIDAPSFLLFGKTTKTETNEQVFNTFSGKDEVVVRGMVVLEGNDEIIIERLLTRKEKRSGGYTIKNKLTYYKVLPDGTEEELEEEHAVATTKKIEKTIGTQADFELVVLATGRNLDDLIDYSPTESGKLLTKFIGLEVLDFKEVAVKAMHKEFSKDMKANTYDIITLADGIEIYKVAITHNKEVQTTKESEQTTNNTEIARLDKGKTDLLNSKEKVDTEISSLNPSKLEEEIEGITNDGKAYKTKIDEFNSQIKEIGEIDFDEDRLYTLSEDLTVLTTEIGIAEAKIMTLTASVEVLKSSEICPSCDRPLEGIDNSGKIKEGEDEVSTIKSANEIKTRKKGKMNTEINELNVTKKEVDKKNKLELERDRAEVEIGALRNKIVGKQNELKKYQLNLEAIELNIRLDAEVGITNTKLEVCRYTDKQLTIEIEGSKNAITRDEKEIVTNTTLIDTINKEDEVDKLFKVYTEMVGKKGISKLVLRSVLPIINSEVQRLLEDVTDFEVEIFIDDKNNVRFLLIKDDVEKLLKSGSGLERTASSLALRCVLGKMSTLPMPNFIAFDEVLGASVANENLEKMKPLFDRIKDMYDIVFFITHNEVVKDWADNIITVQKENNISKILMK